MANWFTDLISNFIGNPEEDRKKHAQTGGVGYDNYGKPSAPGFNDNSYGNASYTLQAPMSSGESNAWANKYGNTSSWKDTPGLLSAVKPKVDYLSDFRPAEQTHPGIMMQDAGTNTGTNTGNSGPATQLPGVENQQTLNTSGLEKYMSEIQKRLGDSRAVAPTFTLDRKPIDDAKATSNESLKEALDAVVGAIESARGNTNKTYGTARTNTSNTYDAIVDSSRTEGKAGAKESGKIVSDELAKAASVAMTGINKSATDSEAHLKEASSNLGGNSAALKEIQKTVDPNGSANSIRDNIATEYQGRAGDAANQVGRDIAASGRMADSIASEGADNLAGLDATLAARNNEYDRDKANSKSTYAGQRASLDSTYADKLMQAQLAQQQAQAGADQSAWQINTQNDATALQSMIGLINGESSANNSANQSQRKFDQDYALLQQKQTGDQKLAEQKAKASAAKGGNNKIMEILIDAMANSTDKNRLNPEDIKLLMDQYAK